MKIYYKNFWRIYIFIYKIGKKSWTLEISRKEWDIEKKFKCKCNRIQSGALDGGP